MKHIAITIAVFLFMTAPAQAGEIRLGNLQLDVSGFLATETRLFANDPVHPGQEDGAQSSVLLQPEFRWKSDNGKLRASVIPYVRYDTLDDERSHFDVREAYVSWTGKRWEVLAGVNKVFWGVVESRHLVDVINQTDFVEDVDEEDKLGQPMIQLTTRRSWGTMELFVLPYFRERTFAGSEGRLRPHLPVDDGAAIYTGGAGKHHVDVALRYSNAFGDWDFGAYVFRGTSREPLMVRQDDVIVPQYEMATQVGTDVQYTRGAWLLKLETILHDADGASEPAPGVGPFLPAGPDFELSGGRGFMASVAGFEYTFFQVGRSAADLGLIVEHLYDGRGDSFTPTLYEDDVFVGARLAMNDTQNTSLLVGAIVDLEDDATVMSLEAERRLGQSWTVEVEGRFFFNAEEDAVLSALQEDDVFTLRLSRHF